MRDGMQPSGKCRIGVCIADKSTCEKAVDANPYMASGDTNIHHDGYNTDTTDSVLPVAIYPEINVSYEKVNANASPAIFFDTYGHAIVPLLGGLAIRDINADETTTEGYFSPKQHDTGDYVIQSSYSFVDESNRIVCPTSNNHVLMLKATDEDGNVLPEFEKVLDIDIKAAAEEKLGRRWIRTCWRSYLTMRGTCGLRPEGSGFIRTGSSRARSAIFHGRQLMPS